MSKCGKFQVNFPSRCSFKFISTSERKINFQKRRTLCRNPMQAPTFAWQNWPTFLLIFLCGFHPRFLPTFLCTMKQKKSKWPKSQIKVDPALLIAFYYKTAQYALCRVTKRFAACNWIIKCLSCSFYMYIPHGVCWGGGGALPFKATNNPQYYCTNIFSKLMLLLNLNRFGGQ